MQQNKYDVVFLNNLGIDLDFSYLITGRFSDGKDNRFTTMYIAQLSPTSSKRQHLLLRMAIALVDTPLSL